MGTLQTTPSASSIDIRQVLMERDGLSQEEANEAYADIANELEEALEDGDLERAYEACSLHGLEPDFLEDLF